MGVDTKPDRPFGRAGAAYVLWLRARGEQRGTGRQGSCPLSTPREAEKEREREREREGGEEEEGRAAEREREREREREGGEEEEGREAEEERERRRESLGGVGLLYHGKCLNRNIRKETERRKERRRERDCRGCVSVDVSALC